MNRNAYELSTLLDVPKWELVQDQLAKLTGTAIITVDYKGIPITKHSCRTEFCSVIRENPVSRKRCYRCDALASLEAVRLDRPYIYLCHCGIVDVAVPVMVGDRHLGAVMFGQVRIPNDDTDNKVERLVNEISSIQTEEEKARQGLLEKYEKLPFMEYRRVEEIAELINSIVNYIVDRAIKNSTDMQTYEWLLRVNEIRPQEIDMQELRAPEVKGGDASAPPEFDVPANSPVFPAVMYIHEHPKESISMKDMADLCHLSHSYFSRLFLKETGENFVSYLNRQKIQRAKKLLRETKMSVSQISGEVGYLNVGHFIEVFKKIEGYTPSVYRQHKYR